MLVGGNNGLGFEDDSDETGENGDTSHNGSDDIFKEENTQPTTEFLKQPLILASEYCATRALLYPLIYFRSARSFVKPAAGLP